MNTKRYLKKNRKYLTSAYKRYVIWGINKGLKGDSFHHIMNHFYTTLSKLDVPVIWPDDLPKNKDLLREGDFVFAVGLAAAHLPSVSGVDYCLHNFDPGTVWDRIPGKNKIKLQVYTNDAEQFKKLDEVTYFGEKDQTLYQPWGTNLLPDEFQPPVFPRRSPFVFWVGSVWDNELNQGNKEDIDELKRVLRKYGLYFVHLRVSDSWNTRLTRLSRIAPAIAGRWQVEHNYLPCRMFKNISYGQLGITNVPKFKDLLGSTWVEGSTIEELVDNSLSLPQRKWVRLVEN